MLATYCIAVGEMPSHDHNIAVNTEVLIGTISQTKGAEQTTASGIVSVETGSLSLGGHGNAARDTAPTYTINATHTHTADIDNTGENKAHNNIMPYAVAIYWRRTA